MRMQTTQVEEGAPPSVFDESWYDRVELKAIEEMRARDISAADLTDALTQVLLEVESEEWQDRPRVRFAGGWVLGTTRTREGVEFVLHDPCGCNKITSPFLLEVLACAPVLSPVRDELRYAFEHGLG